MEFIAHFQIYFGFFDVVCREAVLWLKVEYISKQNCLNSTENGLNYRNLDPRPRSALVRPDFWMSTFLLWRREAHEIWTTGLFSAETDRDQGYTDNWTLSLKTTYAAIIFRHMLRSFSANLIKSSWAFVASHIDRKLAMSSNNPNHVLSCSLPLLHRCTMLIRTVVRNDYLYQAFKPFDYLYTSGVTEITQRTNFR